MPAKRGTVVKKEDEKDDDAGNKGGDAVHEPSSPPAQTPNGTPSRPVEESPAASGGKRKVQPPCCPLLLLLLLRMLCPGRNSTVPNHVPPSYFSSLPILQSPLSHTHTFFPRSLYSLSIISFSLLLCTACSNLNLRCHQKRNQHHPVR